MTFSDLITFHWHFDQLACLDYTARYSILTIPFNYILLYATRSNHNVGTSIFRRGSVSLGIPVSYCRLFFLIIIKLFNVNFALGFILQNYLDGRFRLVALFHVAKDDWKSFPSTMSTQRGNIRRSRCSHKTNRLKSSEVKAD